jgi:chemotaxis regulatin CheY-phosphate phosphatase CheZ
MSDETFAVPTSSEPGSAMTAPSEADYDAILAAVMETVRGRWFLTEYSSRNRHADTELILTAINRIESTLRGERTTQSIDRFRHDLVEMAKAIAHTKGEIAELGKIGDATIELESIVQATEQATSSILAAAEQIQEVAWTMREQGSDNELADQIESRATDIYTALASYELTGQRTQKVVQVMHHLEDRILEMIDIWGGEPATSNGAALPDPSYNNGGSAHRDDLAQVAFETQQVAVETQKALPEPSHSSLNGNGHQPPHANGHIIVEHDLEESMREVLAQAPVKTPAAPAAPRTTDEKSRGQEPPTPLQSAGPSDTMGLVFPADGEPMPLRSSDSGSTPLVVLSQPAFHSGPVLVTPESGWANAAAIEAMTAPALDSVIIISDDQSESPDQGAEAPPDLYALHVERSPGARAGRADSHPLHDAQAARDEATEDDATSIVELRNGVFEFAPLPLSLGPTSGPAAAPEHVSSQKSEAEPVEPPLTRVATLRIKAEPATERVEPRAETIVPIAHPAQPAATGPVIAASDNTAETKASPVVTRAEAKTPVAAATTEVESRARATTPAEEARRVVSPEAKAVVEAPKTAPEKLVAPLSVAAAANAVSAEATAKQDQQVSRPQAPPVPPVAPAEKVEAPASTPSAAAGATQAAKSVRPSAPLNVDPLAALAALTDEEKIALFS